MTYSILYILSLVIYSALFLFFVSCTIVRSNKFKLYLPFVIIAFLTCFQAAFVLNLIFTQFIRMVLGIFYVVTISWIFIILWRHVENERNY